MYVATDLGLPRWWLNEQASTYISGKEDAGKRRVFHHPGLRVKAASPRHIFAMKALAARTRDIDDLPLLAGSPASSEWSQPTADHFGCGHPSVPILLRAESAAQTD